MAATHGFLEVRSSIADAQVFLFDVHLGPVNQRHEVVCKTYFVRTASIDPMRWYTQGRSVAVPCGGTVTIVMEPKGIGPGR
jgi:hypothetical protein